MKKVKLMLLSLSILAVVGGTLAFSAKNGTSYCTTVVTQGADCTDINLTCPDIAPLKATTQQLFLCSTPSVSGGCASGTLNCAGVVRQSIGE